MALSQAQQQQPSNFVLDIASKHIADDATALINKNTVADNNNVAITRSNVATSKSDQLSKEADEVPSRPQGEASTDVPPGVTMTTTVDRLKKPSSSTEQYYPTGGYYPGGYRYRFYVAYPGGYRYGWRYPLWYWRMYAPTLYAMYGPCLYGQAYGDFYYC
ncbi:TPA: hypothetical protein N0F65_001573 [Lagenidium giganteum]|uniref:Uncharacterized protein n=1 Tax=Lagenidium giganteum TaxID=4803 RepID=A0AAV2Z7G2_9STRA|nr:TPA: hypothetical protein N0F65_001573 [Lagenidium giganteum]